MEPTLTKDGPRYTIKLERRLAHPPQRVWRVLTERDVLRQWFPSDVIGEWKVGAELRFEFLHGEGEGLKPEEMQGEVLAVQPLRLIEFRWGESLLRCELISEGEGCRLIFSESFTDGSIAARNAAGWQHCLANLPLVLDGDAPAAFELDEWRGVFERHAADWEPLAGSQQGPPESHPAVREEREASESDRRI